MLFLEKRKGRVRSPAFNPNYRDKVYVASKEDCSVLKLSGELEVGRLRSEDQLLGSVGINIDALPRMMGMFGMTGSGKTNTELILNAQIIDNSPRTVALIFDFAGQLLEGKEIKPQRGLRDHPFFHSKVQCCSSRDGKMAVDLLLVNLIRYFLTSNHPRGELPGSCTNIWVLHGLKRPGNRTRRTGTLS